MKADEIQIWPEASPAELAARERACEARVLERARLDALHRVRLVLHLVGNRRIEVRECLATARGPGSMAPAYALWGNASDRRLWNMTTPARRRLRRTWLVGAVNRVELVDDGPGGSRLGRPFGWGVLLCLANGGVRVDAVKPGETGSLSEAFARAGYDRIPFDANEIVDAARCIEMPWYAPAIGRLHRGETKSELFK